MGKMTSELDLWAECRTWLPCPSPSATPPSPPCPTQSPTDSKTSWLSPLPLRSSSRRSNSSRLIWLILRPLPPLQRLLLPLRRRKKKPRLPHSLLKSLMRTSAWTLLVKKHKDLVFDEV